MEVRFTKHAREKFEVLRKHGVYLTPQQVIDAVKGPEIADHKSRAPLSIAQSTLDQTRVLRVVYRQEGETIIIITFYPGRKIQYENR